MLAYSRYSRGPSEHDAGRGSTKPHQYERCGVMMHKSAGEPTTLS